MNELQQDERCTMQSGKYLLLTRFSGRILEELILCIYCISMICGDKQQSINQLIYSKIICRTAQGTRGLLKKEKRPNLNFG